MTPTRTIDVIPMAEQDWARLRDLRLEMLADAPTAYVETLESAQAADEAEWRFRARRAGGVDNVGVVAVDRAADRFVGTMSAYVDPDRGRTWLVAVYVAPGYRGPEHGVADLLLDAVERWAVERGDVVLSLEVHEDNARAQGFYLRRGYAFTGAARPYDLDESQRELEMSRELALRA
jgi:ribosomal protein S18 acetylase RimI-like enzyme